MGVVRVRAAPKVHLATCSLSISAMTHPLPPSFRPSTLIILLSYSSSLLARAGWLGTCTPSGLSAAWSCSTLPPACAPMLRSGAGSRRSRPGWCSSPTRTRCAPEAPPCPASRPCTLSHALAPFIHGHSPTSLSPPPHLTQSPCSRCTSTRSRWSQRPTRWPRSMARSSPLSMAGEYEEMHTSALPSTKSAFHPRHYPPHIPLSLTRTHPQTHTLPHCPLRWNSLPEAELASGSQLKAGATTEVLLKGADIGCPSNIVLRMVRAWGRLLSLFSLSLLRALSSAYKPTHSVSPKPSSTHKPIFRFPPRLPRTLA
jgi:hypothetical protein